MLRGTFFQFGLAIALALLSAQAYGQLAGSIRGRVTDKDFNDQPLAGVEVRVVQTDQSAVTDEQGAYLITDVPPGTYNLVFTRDGFVREVQTDVLVSAGQLTEIGKSMSSEFTEMDPFIVQEIRLDTGSELGLIELRGETPAFIDSVGEAQLSAAGVGDAAGALSLIAGATVSDNKPVVRGLPDRYVNSQINFVRFPSADRETRSLELDQFPTDVIDNIQVSKTFTPDQQADATGGAVNVVLKGIPDQDILKLGAGFTYNTNLAQADNFRSYGGGGLDFFGIDRGRRNLPGASEGPIALGTSSADGPLEYSNDLTVAKRYEFPDSGWTAGGVLNLFRGHGGSYYDDGTEADLLSQAYNIRPLTTGERRRFFLPDTGERLNQPNGNPRSGNVFDITRSVEEIQWGGLFATGIENENNRINFVYLESNSIEDIAVVATDTRSRGLVVDALNELDAELQADLPFGPFDSQFNGLDLPPDTGEDLAFLRNQTILRRERLIRSAQLRGEHTFAFFDEVPLNDSETFRLLPPEIDWIYAYSSAQRREPDKRVFTSFLNGSGLPDSSPARVVSAGNIPTIGVTGASSGYAQRVWEAIQEDSNQIHLNLKLPFILPNNEEGMFKAGVFQDRVTRSFERDTFVTDGSVVSPSTVFAAIPAGVSFEDFFLSDNLTDAERSSFTTDNASDVDYNGTYDIDAYYLMLDVPVLPILRMVGGFRVEQTAIGIQLDDASIDQFARGADSSNNFVTNSLWFDFNNGIRTVNSDTGQFLGDVDQQRTDLLPSLTFIFEPTEQLSFRVAYSQTIARPTFRELTVIRDQEFLGSTPFFGNDSLAFAEINNYDFRADYRPTPGGLISFSVFYKEIENPIEYITVVNDTIQPEAYLVPVNFSQGTILGAELEVRQDLGDYFEELAGLSLGANGTIIESEVDIPELQRTDPTGETSRPMLNAPDMLLNLFAVYRNQELGTELGLFYTVRGETLVAGSSPAAGDLADFVPNVFQTQYDTLNFTVAQELGEYFKIKFSARNLTDPAIQRVYRSPVTPEAVQGSFSRGIDLSISLSASFEF